MLETQVPPMTQTDTGPMGQTGHQEQSAQPEQDVCERVKRSLSHIYTHLMGVVEQERKLVSDAEACEREQNTLREQSEALMNREQLITQREAELNDRQQQLDQFEAEVRAKGEQLEQTSNEVNALREDFMTRVRTLEDCERVIAQFEQTFGRLVNAPEMRLSDAVDELARFMDRHTV